jgi:hypothetical protein
MFSEPLNHRGVVVVSAVTIMLLATVLAVLPAGGTTTTPEPDGSAAGSCGSCTSVTISLTTVHSPDVIIVYQSDGSCAVPNLPHDTSGLTYLVREDALYCNNLEGYETYAIAQVPLSADNVTCSAQTSTAISCIAFGVSGANTTAGDTFDGQPTVTSTGGGYQSGASCPQGSVSRTLYPCTSAISTTKLNDYVITMGTDTGHTLMTSDRHDGLSLIAATNSGHDGYAEWTVASTIFTGQQEPFGTAIGNGFLVISDVIAAAAASSSGTTSSTTTSITSSSTSSTTSSSTSSISTQTETSACVVTFTGIGNNVTQWSGAC